MSPRLLNDWRVLRRLGRRDIHVQRRPLRRPVGRLAAARRLLAPLPLLRVFSPQLPASPLRAPPLMRHRSVSLVGSAYAAAGDREPRDLSTLVKQQRRWRWAIRYAERCARILVADPLRNALMCAVHCSVTRNLRVNACLCYMHVQSASCDAHCPLPFSRPLVLRIRVACAHVALVSTCTHPFISNALARRSRHFCRIYFTSYSLLITLVALFSESASALLLRLRFTLRSTT